MADNYSNTELNGQQNAVLLKFINLNTNRGDSKAFDQNSTQKEVAIIEEYYRLADKGVHRSSGSVTIGSGSDAKTLSPTVGTIGSGQWLDMHTQVLNVEYGKPAHNNQYPKHLSCQSSGGWLAITGQNGVLVVEKSLVVSRDPLFIVRRNGLLVVLEDGFQGIDFGEGGHLVLLAFGAVVVFEGNGGVNESSLIYLCLRPNVLANHSIQPLRPILRVYPANGIYIVQVRQRILLLAKSVGKWSIVLSEHFYPLEFQTILQFYGHICNNGLVKNNGQSYAYPPEVVLPHITFPGMGEPIESLHMIQKGRRGSPNTYEIIPRKGQLLMIGNCDHLPSPVVIESNPNSKVKFERYGNASAFVMTTNALQAGGLQHIESISPGKYILDAENSKCHICFIFTGGLLLMVGSDKYSHE